MKDIMDEEKKLIKIEDESLKKKIYEALEQVEDPELGIDIVNLGLINEVNLYEEAFVEIKMTLTTMGCPFADQIQDDIQQAVGNLKEVKQAKVQLVWYPAWTPDRMSRYARIALGVH